ncbi:Uncharacterised protein [Orientia tsutsugamushi]|uniref:DUF5394 family protein n=1 Tax=Orientia tsutsugamushi TaxID=784 RepID=UPI0005F93DBC|nr:DUF5394 family protein [Orientia tsutsugamushi]KJV73889.1 hypothetical protein OTSTA763_1381 [Orientia tsutsugamushi str. TA763]SPP24719.1 Uncharacterised protein [Orientia tsutsugamushi]
MIDDIDDDDYDDNDLTKKSIFTSSQDTSSFTSSQDTSSDNLVNEFYQKLKNNAEFEAELEALISNFEINQDVSKLQTNIILLIKKLLLSNSSGSTSIELTQELEQQITKQIAKISKELIYKHTRTLAEENQDLEQNKDNLEYISEPSRAELKKNLKRFAIYEVYKLLNPRRIAGETRLSNFIHNLIIGGAKYALKYGGGNKNDVNYYNNKLQAMKFHKKSAERGDKDRGGRNR